ncbi:MAG: hypothetical protein COA78_15870 [Blastopirellula sp.]|nr:MAG: hypothetical protein COA78_15870 [Blastopirellula sp.]
MKSIRMFNSIATVKQGVAFFSFFVIMFLTTPVNAQIELQHIRVGGDQEHCEWGSNDSVVTQVGPNHFKMELGNQPGIPHQAAFPYFQILASAKGNPLRMDVVPAKGHNGSYKEYFYSWSTDKVNWHPINWQGRSLVFPEFPGDQVWVAGQVPLSYNQLDAMTKVWKKNPNVTVHTVGKSFERRNLYRVVITDPQSPHAEKDRWVHYFANQHGCEHNAQWRMIGMLDWALSEEAADFRKRSICHFVIMMSPDSPSHGWMRGNAEGIDMNRSYLWAGSDRKLQTTEPYFFQKDFEALMASESPVTDIWSCHTWGGKVDILTNLGPEIGKQVGTFEKFDWILDRTDPDQLVNPILGKEGGAETKWSTGPHKQFGITAFLCEGSAEIRTKKENKQSGQVIIKSLSNFYTGTKNSSTK